MSSANTTPSRFTVIQGGGNKTSPWLDLPKTVAARSPFNRAEVGIYRISRLTLSKADHAQRRQPVLDAWTGIVGKLPPVNNAAKIMRASEGRSLIKLADAHACFRGVKRPVGNDQYGFDTIVFIGKPTWMVRYCPDLACVIEWSPVPSDLVFATYVRLDHPAQGRYGTPGASGMVVNGVITHWHFVEADQTANDMPVNYRERYRKRLW